MKLSIIKFTVIALVVVAIVMSYSLSLVALGIFYSPQLQKQPLQSNLSSSALDVNTKTPDSSTIQLGIDTGDMTLVSISPLSSPQKIAPDNLNAVFSGTTTVLGKYNYSFSEFFGNDMVCLTIDDKNEMEKLPHFSGAGAQSIIFCFANLDYAKKEFGPEYNAGTTKVTINNYRIKNTGTEAIDLADLVSVQSKQRDEVASASSVASTICTLPPETTDNGGRSLPINPEYKNLSFLGQLFTAAACGTKRLRQLDWVVSGDYKAGSALTLNRDPESDLLNILESIGYKCLDNGDRGSCRKWELTKTVRVKDLLRLEPFVDFIERDDCILCK